MVDLLADCWDSKKYFFWKFWIKKYFILWISRIWTKIDSSLKIVDRIMPILTKLNLSQDQIISDFQTIQETTSSAQLSRSTNDQSTDQKVLNTEQAVENYEKLKEKIDQTEEILKSSQVLVNGVIEKLGESEA